jgi:hypothetical protein
MKKLCSSAAVAVLAAVAVTAAAALSGCDTDDPKKPVRPARSAVVDAPEPSDEPEPDESLVVGDWIADSLNQNGDTLGAAQLLMIGAWTLELEQQDGEWLEDEDLPEGTLYLFLDGTCEVSFWNEDYGDCSWQAGNRDAAVVQFDGSAYDAVIDEDGWLVLEDTEWDSVLYYTADDPPGDITLTLDAGGDFTFEAMGETVEGSWEWDGEYLTLFIDGEPSVTGFLDGESLVLEIDDDAVIILIPA